MRGLLMKDFLTIRKKYGARRLVIDLAIIAALLIALQGTGAVYISLLLIPLEATSMVISLATCDEQWKWGKYVVALPVSKEQVVRSRYAFAGAMALAGFVAALAVNLLSYLCFPAFRLGFYLFVSFVSLCVTLAFLSFVLPSNYSLGVNAGFAAMIVLVVLLVVLGIWSRLTGDAVMWFVVEHFEASMGIALACVALLCVASYVLSTAFVRRRYA